MSTPSENGSTDTSQLSIPHPLGLKDLRLWGTGCYLVVFVLINILLLIQLFDPIPACDCGTSENQQTAVSYRLKTFVFGTYEMQAETRLFLMVALIGAVGSLLHALRSYNSYVGGRQFLANWIPFYLVKPFTGASMAVVFYFLFRGGFFAPGVGAESVSEFGFFALAGLIGLFSEEAVEKLKDVAETLLKKKEKQPDPLKFQSQDKKTESPKETQ